MRYLGFLFLLLALPAQAEAPQVVASIKPLAGIVAAVMEGVGTPTVLVKGDGSPHLYQMKPSDAKALDEAVLVVWVGPMFERFLEKPLAGKKTILTMADLPGLRTYKPRKGGLFEADDDGDADGPIDGHVWLDPYNASLLALAVARRLGEADPLNAARYDANAKNFVKRARSLDKKIAAKLSDVRGVPFILFHDSTQVFEKRYGLSAVGAILVSPEQQASAARVTAIRDKIKDAAVACVFSEPSFLPGLVKTLTEGTGAKTGELDAEGAALDVSPQLYFKLMIGLTNSLERCLNR